MLSKQQIKFVQSLKLKKYRQQYAAFITEGDKMVSEMLLAKAALLQIYALPDWIQQHTALLQQNNYQTIVQEVSEKELSRISFLETPNKVLAVCTTLQEVPDEDTLKKNISLVLDDIKDPGNLGTIIRTADWFGLPYIFCSPECVDVYNPKVVQATMGSLLRVQVFYQPLPALFDQNDQIAVYGALLLGKNAFTTTIRPPAFVVIGNEAHGISEQVLPYIQTPITIPRTGSAESLNAAVATGIICALVAKANQ